MVNWRTKMNLASPNSLCIWFSLLSGRTHFRQIIVYIPRTSDISLENVNTWCPCFVNGYPMLYGVSILGVWDNHCPFIINYFLSFWMCSWEYAGLNIIDTQGYITVVLCNWNRSEITSYIRDDGKRKTKRIWLLYIVVIILMNGIPICLHAPITVSKLLLQMCCVLPADASNELAILLTSAIIATKSLSLFTAEPTPCVHTW